MSDSHVWCWRKSKPEGWHICGRPMHLSRRIGRDLYLHVNRGKEIPKDMFKETLPWKDLECLSLPKLLCNKHRRRWQCPEVAHLPVENQQRQDSAPTQGNLFQKFTFSLLQQYKQQSDMTVSLHMVVNWICP